MLNKIDWIFMSLALATAVISICIGPDSDKLLWTCCALWIIKAMIEKAKNTH